MTFFVLGLLQLKSKNLDKAAMTGFQKETKNVKRNFFSNSIRKQSEVKQWREAWSCGYGRRLASKRSWVRIPPYIGWM
jgi:hypothetical protein